MRGWLELREHRVCRGFRVFRGRRARWALRAWLGRQEQLERPGPPVRRGLRVQQARREFRGPLEQRGLLGRLELQELRGLLG